MMLHLMKWLFLKAHEKSFPVITIFYAIFISSAEIPGWFIAIMVVFVVVFWGNHILMGVSKTI